MKYLLKTAFLVLIILSTGIIACKNKSERIADTVRTGNQQLKEVAEEGNAEIAETVRDENIKLNKVNADPDSTAGEKLDAELDAKANILDEKIEATNEYMDTRDEIDKDIKDELKK